MLIITSAIKTKIYTDFASTYRNAAPFVSSGSLWDFCMDVVTDPILLQCIIFANDLEIPPVKSLLHLYKLKFSPADTFVFSQSESQCMGSLMGFIFKFILGYSSQKERNQVNVYGVKTATRFLEGPTNLKIS